MKKIVGRLLAILGLDDKEFKKGLDKAEKKSNAFSKNIKKIGVIIAAAFSIAVLKKFTLEILKLSAKAQGVERAFKKLDRPGLLNDLREATRGTVDNVTLMQKAIQAKNFKIPLEQLATYFKFATNRAIETGESVDYLVNSIITGIGRKSVLVMDNLGISAAELQEEVKKVGDFGEASGIIIQREIEKAGDIVDTTATKIERLGASWTNAKKSLGDYLAQSKNVTSSLEEWGIFFDLLTDKAIGFGKKLRIIFRKEYLMYAEEVRIRNAEMGESALEMITSYDKAGSALDMFFRALKKLKEAEEEQITTLNDLQFELSELETLLKQTNLADKENLKTIIAQIEAKKKQIKVWENWIKTQQRSLQPTMPGGVPEPITGTTGISTMGFSTEDINSLAGSLRKAKTDTREFELQITGLGNVTAGVFNGMQNIIADTLGETEITFASFAKSLIKILTGLIAKLIAATIAAAALALVLSIITGGGATIGGIFSGAKSFGDFFKTAFSSMTGVNIGKNLVQTGMQSGGKVPPGYPGDTYPALLTSGERVLNPVETKDYERGQTIRLVFEPATIKGEVIYLALKQHEQRRKHSF